MNFSVFNQKGRSRTSRYHETSVLIFSFLKKGRCDKNKKRKILSNFNFTHLSFCLDGDTLFGSEFITLNRGGMAPIMSKL